ncbi:hypothetical protein [Mesomycoplasma hyopneumoniae]|nr:hypothetical protein [Mesomycoplasma hyopneumoniae]
MSLENPLELKQEQNYEGIREREREIKGFIFKNPLKTVWNWVII